MEKTMTNMSQKDSESDNQDEDDVLLEDYEEPNDAHSYWIKKKKKSVDR